MLLTVPEFDTLIAAKQYYHQRINACTSRMENAKTTGQHNAYRKLVHFYTDKWIETEDEIIDSLDEIYSQEHTV